jgi:hypothetical protein
MLVQRAKNLDLARWMCGGHKRLTEKLSAISNWTYISKMIHEEMKIDVPTARRIEGALHLPGGWMDRDNCGLAAMSSLDFQLHQRIALASDEQKTGLLRFLTKP